MTSLLGPADASDPSALLPAITQASQRLHATATALPDADWSAPSLCAGWTRGDVLAHLALNAEALSGVVQGAAGAGTPMYPSNEKRDGDIADLAAAGPRAVRERIARANAGLSLSFKQLASVSPDTPFERTPGGPMGTVAILPLLRLRELEIHLVDLDLDDHHWSTWPTSTSAAFLAYDVAKWASVPVRISATDVEGATWTAGAESGADVVEVSGTLHDLAWWATGRDPGPVLSASSGEVPILEAR